MGLRLVLADHRIERTDLDLFDEGIVLPPPSEVDRALAVVLRAARTRRFDALLAQTEDALLLGSLVARELGLPGPSPESAWLSVDKHASRRTLAAAGLCVPAFALARNGSDVRRFAQEHGYPVVLKAPASALSRLVQVVTAPEEAEPAVARMLAGLPRSTDIARLEAFERAGGPAPSCDARREFLVESFARGVPLETDGVLQHGRALTYGVTEQVLSSDPRFYFEGYLFPADLDETAEHRILAASTAALAALGLDATGFSIEFRWHEGRATIIEVNGRLGWDEGFGNLFAVRTGSQPLLDALQIALGMPVGLPSRTRSPRAALAYRSCYEERVATRLPRRSELERRAGPNLEFGLCCAEGSRFHAPPDPRAFPHVAFALAKDPSSSRSAYARARAAVDALPIELAPAAEARAVLSAASVSPS